MHYGKDALITLQSMLAPVMPHATMYIICNLKEEIHMKALKDIVYENGVMPVLFADEGYLKK